MCIRVRTIHSFFNADKQRRVVQKSADMALSQTRDVPPGWSLSHGNATFCSRKAHPLSSPPHLLSIPTMLGHNIPHMSPGRRLVSKHIPCNEATHTCKTHNTGCVEIGREENYATQPHTIGHTARVTQDWVCLLYTSDAADE